MPKSDKPQPLKVFGRTHYACTRCKLSKIKCSGEKPACANCKSINKSDACIYPNRDRKIVIMESDLNRLHDRLAHLERLARSYDPNADLSPPSSKNLAHEKPERPLETVQARLVDHTGLQEYTQEAFLLPDAENQAFQWRLLLELLKRLPEKAYTLKLVYKVYNTYSQEFYLMDMLELRSFVDDIYVFLDQYKVHRDKGQDPSFYRAIAHTPLSHLFAIIAFGEQLYNTSTAVPASPTLARPKVQRIPGIGYYLTAANLFQLTQEETTMQFIQCAMLLALYSANLNRYNTVYNYFGVAVRLAVANGFHRQRELTPGPSQHLKDEKIKRLWWTLFVVDTAWAAKMNMPVHIDYADTDIDLPAENRGPEIGDNFNTGILDDNLHLTKYIANFVKVIYGPNIRTNSVNYISTDLYNQKLLTRNILLCLKDVVSNFEGPALTKYRNTSIIQPNDRNLGNLHLRYHQLVILTVKPLLLLVVNKNLVLIMDNYEEVESAIATGLSKSLSNMEILLKFYENNKTFILGFWDSQHLFLALLMLLMASTIAGASGDPLIPGIALLKWMADNKNINAQNCMGKLSQVNEFLGTIPEVKNTLDLEADIQQYVQRKRINRNYNSNIIDDDYDDDASDDNDELPFFNPFHLESSRNFHPLNWFKDQRLAAFSERSQDQLLSMVNTIQSWDNFRGLPIHIYGTERSKMRNDREAVKTETSGVQPNAKDLKYDISSII